MPETWDRLFGTSSLFCLAFVTSELRVNLDP